MQTLKWISRLSYALVLLTSLPLQAQLVDRVVAVVNKDVITQTELNARTQVAIHQLKRQSTELPPQAQLRNQVLERLIMEHIQSQIADTVGIRIDELMLDRAITRIAESNKLTMADFRKAIAEEGLSWEEFRETIRTEMTLSQLREREINSRIVVTDAEIEEALQQKVSAEQASSEYLIAHILLRAPEGASPEQWKAVNKRAEDLMQRIMHGEDFGKLAASFSDAQDAMNGGVIDWRQLRRLPELFAQRIPSMKKGDISPALRSPVGLHVFKILDVRQVEQKRTEVEQTQARHILLRPSEALSEETIKRRLNDLRDRIKNGADFAALAKSNSADLSAAKGGDLGWLNPGDTVPDFERAMNALKPGEVSEVIESPFGWHLIQVIARRKADVTDDLNKTEVYKAIKERKADEAYEDWLRQQRDMAYVEIRPEDD